MTRRALSRLSKALFLLAALVPLAACSAETLLFGTGGTNGATASGTTGAACGTGGTAGTGGSVDRPRPTTAHDLTPLASSGIPL